MSTIAAGTTTGTALVNTGDTTGQLVLKTNGTTTAVTIGTNQVVTLAQPLPAGSGGTGVASLTANNVLLGNGTSAVQFVAPGTAGNVLASNGTTWTSATPATGAMVALSSVSASGASTVTFNSSLITSTYSTYAVIFSGWVPSVDRPAYYAEVTTNNFSSVLTCNYITIRTDSVAPSVRAATTGTSIFMVTPGTFSTTLSDGGGSGIFWLYNPSATNVGRGMNWTLGGYSSNSANQEYWAGSATYLNATTAINGLRFAQASGTITGVFTLYGVKNS